MDKNWPDASDLLCARGNALSPAQTPREVWEGQAVFQLFPLNIGCKHKLTLELGTLVLKGKQRYE